jgi:Protein of unknown function (DUF2971)
MYTRIDDVLRRSARLLALTNDRDQTDGADPASRFHRGWGRAPMWAHYANGHRGVCLVLDTMALIEVVRDLPVRIGRFTSWGRIYYADKPISLDLSGTFVNQRALDAALEELIARPWEMSGLYVTKNTDWAYETEFRFAVVDLGLRAHELDTELYVPMGNCLKAVIFGEDHPAPGLIAHGIQRALGGDSPEFFQCRWVHGAPTLEPLTI